MVQSCNPAAANQVSPIRLMARSLALQDLLAAFSLQCRAGSLWRDKDARVDPCVRCRSSLLGLGTGGPGLAQHGGDRPWRGAIRRAGALRLRTRVASDPLARPMGQLAVG